MKKLLFIKVSRASRFALLLCLLLTASKSFAQLFSDEGLYANGHKSYISRDWVYASVYLFAYIERNPKQFNDAAFKAEVVGAYDFAVGQLNSLTIKYNDMVAREKAEKDKNKSGVGSITSGLEVHGPPLRAPSQVSMVRQSARTDSTTVRQKMQYVKPNN